MKFLKSLGIFLLLAMMVTSCEKEYSEEGGSASSALGTLKSDISGECLPSSIIGIFSAGTALNATNAMQVTVDFTTVGTYLITTDTVNGYFFRGVGLVTGTGETQVTLAAVGTPATAGSNTFTVRYGASVCNIVVDVLPAGAGAAVFTPGGTPGTCGTATLAGTYTVGTAVTSANTVTIGVNVTTPGTYNISIPAVNGISFTGSGSLAATGAQNVTLVASGTPAAAGSFNYIINGSAGSSCTFSVPVTGAGAAAVYTLGGAPANCTGFTVNGTFQAGLPTGATNTARFNVTVTTPGTYSISTTAVNGVTFSGSGSFATAGATTVTLTASGTPAVPGVFNYPATGSGSSCSFSVTYTAGTSAAVFTMVGAGSTCSPGTVAGTYTAGTALTPANTVTVQVNVTTAGSYTLTSNVVNGMTFSATGVFATTGPQTVVLTGTGNPAAAGTNTFSVGSSPCTFSVTVVGTTTDFISFKLDGGALISYNVNADATVDNVTFGFPVLDIYGELTSSATEPSIQIAIGKQTGGAITAGTYTVNQAASGILVLAYYYDAAGTEFSTESGLTTQTPGFTIIITSITATRVSGTFSGQLKQGGTGPAVRNVTEGSFSLPLP